MDALDFAKQIPAWLDQALFDRAFRSYENDQTAKVSSFELKAALAPGDNFASAVFRGAIKFSSKYTKGEKELSVIVKTLPAAVELPGFEHMKDTTLFENEIAMYTEVLPQIESVLQSAGDSDVMCPKLIYQTLAPKPVIIFEDVSVSGYNTMIKKLHDDFELSMRVIKRLAKYHAAGFYLNSEQSIDASKFKISLFATFEVAKTMFDETFDVFIEKLQSWEGFEQYVEPVRNFKENFIEIGLKSYTPGTGTNSYNVLNHGDFHFKNILYKMNEGKVEDFMFYDYQITVCATPAVDLSYALYNFVSDDNRENRYDEILQIYHTQFVESLKKYGYIKPPPSLLDLQIEMMRNGNVQAFLAICLYPFLLVDLNTFAPEDFAAGPRAFKAKIYESEHFKDVMSRELKKFVQKGYLKTDQSLVRKLKKTFSKE